MAERNDYSTSAASNTARWPESMARASVNNMARENEAISARDYKDNNGSLVTAGSSTVYTVTLNSQHSAWFDGLTFRARMDETCGATPTINPTGSGALGAKSIYWNDGTQVAAGDLVANGVYDFVYKSGTDRVYVLSAGAPPVAASSETVAGKVELATQAEVNTGTDTARAITPAGLTGWTPAVGTVTVVSTDKVLLADASASGVLKQGLVSDITALSMPVATSVAAVSLASTAGTTFSSLPADLDWIDVIIAGWSLDDTDNFLVQIGDAGGLHTSGYASASGASVTSTAGFVMLPGNAASDVSYGAMRLRRVPSTEIWVSDHSIGIDSDTASAGGGQVTLDTDLTQLAVLDTGGDNFDAGSVAIRYGRYS